MLRVLNVTEALVIQNELSYPDADGRPAHSFEVVVRGGVDQTLLDTLILFAPSGIQTTTTVAPAFQVIGSSVDANGDSQVVSLSRPETVPVYLELDYTLKVSGSPSDVEAQMLQAMLDFDATLNVGDGVNPDDIRSAVLCAFDSNPFSSLIIRMGLTSSPPTAATVPTSKTQLADFDSSRILITEIL
jgi:hypothetical protein